MLMTSPLHRRHEHVLDRRSRLLIDLLHPRGCLHAFENQPFVCMQVCYYTFCSEPCCSHVRANIPSCISAKNLINLLIPHPVL
jgi:hypothetical protein